MGLFDFLKKYEVKPFRFTVAGNEVMGYLYSPKKWNQKGIVYLHGGFDFYPKPEVYEDVIAYANAGYAVLLIKYDTEGWENIASQDYNKDVQEAIDAGTQFRAMAKPRKLFLMGLSRGCAVAYGAYAAAVYKIPPNLPLPQVQRGKLPLFGKEGPGEIFSNLWDGGVFLAGPTDIPSFKTTTKIPPATLEKMLFYFKTSPIDNVYSSEKSKAMLLIYGWQDIVVPSYQGTLMAKKLGLVTGRDFFVLSYGHGLASEKETQDIVLKWMEKK